MRTKIRVIQVIFAVIGTISFFLMWLYNHIKVVIK